LGKKVASPARSPGENRDVNDQLSCSNATNNSKFEIGTQITLITIIAKQRNHEFNTYLSVIRPIKTNRAKTTFVAMTANSVEIMFLQVRVLTSAALMV
jgi:hypothetical protein